MVEVERWTFTKGYQDWRSEHQLSLQYTQLGPFSGVVVQPWPVTFFGFSAHQSFLGLLSFCKVRAYLEASAMLALNSFNQEARYPPIKVNRGDLLLPVIGAS